MDMFMVEDEGTKARVDEVVLPMLINILETANALHEINEEVEEVEGDDYVSIDNIATVIEALSFTLRLGLGYDKAS